MGTVDAPLLRRVLARVAYASNPRAYTAWRMVRRLGRIVPDRDVLAQFSGKPFSTPGGTTVGSNPLGKRRLQRRPFNTASSPKGCSPQLSLQAWKMVCRKIEQERPDQGRFVQDGAPSARQYTRVDSKHTQLGPAPFEEAEHLPFPFMSPLAHPLSGIAPIGETSPVRRPLTGHFSATYDWSWDCPTSVAVSLQERIDAENSEDSERRGRLHAQRSQ